MTDKKMKIAVGSILQEGSFGGGNQFAKTLSNFLLQGGHSVTNNLNSKDIDLILVTEPRSWLQISAFNMNDALAYRQRHPQTKIILRINECDERKGTKLKLLNRYLAHSAKAADHVVFISRWLADLFTAQEPSLAQTGTVIRNGADTAIFHARGYQPWQPPEPLKVVTHHWSAHPYKGLDVYHRVDQLQGGAWADKLHFTYIGNKPRVPLPHTTFLQPLSGHGLAKALRQHHVYLTASLHEPAGMHHIEGALCGLPPLYRSSGALPEYNHQIGVNFIGPNDIEQALQTMQHRYHDLLKQMPHYPHTATVMCQAYEKLFRYLLSTATQQPPGFNKRLQLAADQYVLRLAPYFNLQ